MYKILAIQTTLVLQILCEEPVPDRTSSTSGTTDLGIVQKEFLTIMKQAVEEAIDHQQNSNLTEPLDVSQLKELGEMLRTLNGTDLEELQSQYKEALRHGRLDVTLADMAKMFNTKKETQLKLQHEGDLARAKMQKKIDSWMKKEMVKEEQEKAKLQKEKLLGNK